MCSSKNQTIWVVKIGSAVLVNNNNSLNHTVMHDLVEDIIFAQSQGISVILVTSGAVAAGNIAPMLSKGAKSAVGQLQLIRTYRELFDRKNTLIAQYLITREDFSDRKRYICLRSSLEEIIRNNIVPIINDNDVLHEARESFSDNDQLASYLSIMMGAKKLCILSSVDGIYTHFGSPKQKKIDQVSSIQELEGIDVSHKTSTGTGGMKSKIKSLIMVMQSGIESCIANGKTPHILQKVIKNTASTTAFIPEQKSKSAKGIKKWLFAGADPLGAISMTDQGSNILKQKKQRKSVLLKGVEAVEGNFFEGDVIRVLDTQSNEIGYGVAKMSADQIEKQKGSENKVVIHADYFLVK